MSKVRVTACKCDKCGHIWLGRIKDPVCCPKCKSAYWNRGKAVTKSNNVNKPKLRVGNLIVTPVPKEVTTDRTGGVLIEELVEEPTVKRNPTKDEQRAFSCAYSMKFNCNFYETRTSHFDFCKACFDAPFWKLKDRYLMAMDNKVEDKTIDVPENKWGEACKNCPEYSVTRGIPNCYYRNIGKTKYSYCTKCWESIDMWGDKAAGYKDRKEKDNND